jgi:hypothetical protein
MNKDEELPIQKQREEAADNFVGNTRNKTSIKETVNERDGDIDDFYAKRDPYAVDKLHRKDYEDFKEKLSPEQLELLNSGKQFYELNFSNIGGIPMPIILQFTFTDGTDQLIHIPAEIWRRHEEKVSKVFIFDRQLASVHMDPFLETADTDVSNNHWPERQIPTRFELFREKNTGENPMQRQKRLEEMD